MSTEFVGIELELRGAEGVYNDLQEIDRVLHSFRGKQKINSGMTALKKDIVAARGELEKLQREQKKWQDLQKRVGKENMSAFGTREMERNAQAIQKTKNKLKDLQQAEREVSAATRNMGRTFTQEMNAISSKVGHIGSAMQSLGNSLIRISSPMRRITSGILMGAGYKALNLFTEGLGSSFERYDVMKNYSRTLEAFGFNAEAAQASIEKLNDSVLGLPTGLDEIVAAQKVYVGATNDLEKSTNMAIAANNTFLASGMGSREQRFMQKYLVALGSGAELAASQWDSMSRIAPMAMRAVANELNYSKNDYQQFLSDVKKGKIATDDFLEAFIKVGKEGTIADAANVMKMSFEGLSANIQNAAKRMGEGALKALDEVFMSYNGRTLLQTLLGVDAEGNDMGDGVKHWIDNLSQSIQGWIKAHPEEITDFFETMRSIDWIGLAKGFGQGALQVLDILEKFATWASGKDLSKVGRFMVWSNVIGNGLLILGGALKGTRHIFGLVGALAKFGVKGGLLGGILSGLFGSGGGGVLAGAGGAVLGAGIGKGTFLGIGKIGLVAAEITGIVGAITTMASGFAALDMKLISSAFNSFRKVTENLGAGIENLQKIRSTDFDMDALKELVKKVAEAYQALSGIPMSASVAKRMATSSKNLRNAIFQLRRVAYQINQASGTTVNEDGFAAFVEQIRQAIYDLQQLSGIIELKIKVKLNQMFATSVKTVTTTISDARKAINKYKAPISYSIPVTITFSVTSNLASALLQIRNQRQSLIDASKGNSTTDPNFIGPPRYPAMGGAIYRKRGGNVGFPGRPRGTDRVPAWLSAGEFVQNKRAVSTFGIDFMRKVNNLDIKGAMNELMHRAGHMANINRGTTITNNNYNNQKVVINNNGSTGAGFTFKRASRFVGAL